MQSLPRPPASVPLGGSLRASRAAQLARPEGPLAAVDLADGRALLVGPLGAGWVALEDEARTFTPEYIAPASEPAPPPRVPARRRRLGTALALAAALGAATIVLATGFSGAPSPAVAGPTARPSVSTAPAPPGPSTRPRGGRAIAPASPKAAPPAPAPAPTPAPAAVPADPSPPPAPAPPPLPQLPSAPAL